MKVKLLVSRSGNDGTQNIGDIVDVPANEIEAMLAAGQCELLRNEPVERAVKTAKAEKAAR